MAKDLYLDVVARKNSKELSTLAGEFDRLSKETDDFGKKMHETGTFSQFLDKELTNTKAKAKELGEEFERTGKADVFASLKGAQANVKSLERIKKDLTSALEDGAKEAEHVIGKAIEDGGEEGFKTFGSSIQGWLSTPVVGPIVEAGIIGGVIAAAPAISAALGGAVIAGGGLGLIGAGIAGQLHTPMVQSALSDLGDDAEGVFTRATATFGPATATGFRIIGAEIDKLEPKLETIFSRVAPLAEEVFGGAAGFIDRLEPGIDALSRAAGPVIGELAADLPQLGGALSSMLESISSDAPAAALGLHDMFQVIEIGVEATGKIIQWGETTYKWLRILSAGATGHALDAAVSIEGLGSTTAATGVTAQGAATDFAGLSSQLGQTTQTASTLAGQMSDKVFASLMNADEATLGLAQAQTRLSDTLDQGGLGLNRNKTALDLHKAAGQADEAAILGVVQANIRSYDTAIQSGMGATDAALAYDKNTASLNSQLLHAGYTQKAIDGLIGKYKAVPDNVNTAIATKGLTDAITDLDDLLRIINHIPRVINVTVDEHTKGNLLGTYNQQVPYAARHASGGSTAAGRSYLVGENGPEIVAFSQPGYITPNGQLGSRYGGGSDGAALGARSGTTQVLLAARDPQAAWLLDQMRILVDARGGNVQRVVGRPGAG
jgi:hypothetical protein